MRSLLGFLALSLALTSVADAQPSSCGDDPAVASDAGPPTDCPEPGTIDVVQSTRLTQQCDYADVTFRVIASDVTLDCGGALLQPRDQAPRVAIEVLGSIHDVVVRNCRIRGHHRGVDVRREMPAAEATEMRDTYRRLAADPTAQREALLLLDEAARSRAPHDVLIEQVSVRDTGHVGVYLHPFVHHVRIRDVVVTGVRLGPGVYLDGGSRRVEIDGGCFAGNAREGVAIDASAQNVIRRSRFEANGEGGVFLYKNAFEAPTRHLPRTQHSRDNLIEGNVFDREKRGVWVGYRASANYAQTTLEWGDPIVYRDDEVIYRADYAEHVTIVGNHFVENAVDAVLIEDDHAIVLDNRFTGNPSRNDVAVVVGSRGRWRSGRPVYGATVRHNEFDANVSVVGRVAFCAGGLLWSDNRVGATAVEPRREECDGPQALHPALILVLP